MKNLITLTILSLAFLIQVQAQLSTLKDNTSTEPYQVSKGQNEVGLSFEFNDGDGLGLNLNYKYALTNNLHLRSRIQVPSFRFGNNADEGKNISLETAGFSVGLEYHIPIKKRWSFYFGGEVGAKLIRFSPSSFAGSTTTTSIKTSFVDVITGVKYHANKRLSIFAEMNYRFSSDQVFIDNEDFSTSSRNFIIPELGVLLKFGKK